MSESYTYSFKQFRIIIKKIGNLYTFAIINQDTNEFFQSQETELKRISQQTLTAAFNDKVKNITSKTQIKLDQIVYEDSDHLKITIKVSLDFLPQFCQDILLNKVQKGEEQVQKIHYLELQNQIKIVQKQLQTLIDTYTNKKVIILQKQTQSVNGVQNIWNLNIQKGEYLAQCCGYSLVFYDGSDSLDIYQQQTDSYYGNISSFKARSNFLFEVNLNKDCVYSVHSKPFDYSNYQYPFIFNFFMHVEQESQLSVNVKDVNNKPGTLNNIKLILQKIKISK